MNDIIEVQSLREFPHAPVFGFCGKSIEEIRKWAERNQAVTVWAYRHKFGNEMYTAARLVVEASKGIEQASAQLLGQAEGAL